jgi:dTDP-4-amino-4,6-dideoxygalactose transaminase
MIPVTKPFLPPLDEYTEKLKGVYERNWLTNDGPLVRELEGKLSRQLGIEHLLYVSNGTIAIQIAIKALGLKGKIITTPFSYVATSSSILWEGCEPVFVDIAPDNFNIDPLKIEAAITPDVSGIIATHCFGIPCDVEAIGAIAQNHNLKVIYDAAHAFGTKINKRSVFEFGDITTCSFHATKLFHTVEGGSISTRDAELSKRMTYMRNFGHDGPERFNGIGINGKNSEFHAAMGLVNLEYVDSILKERRKAIEFYCGHLDSNHVKLPPLDNLEWNCAYFPIVFRSEKVALRVKEQLESKSIFPRRYFYPSLDSVFEPAKAHCSISLQTSKSILCLPLFSGIGEKEMLLVVGEINSVLKREK